MKFQIQNAHTTRAYAKFKWNKCVDQIMKMCARLWCKVCALSAEKKANSKETQLCGKFIVHSAIDKRMQFYKPPSMHASLLTIHDNKKGMLRMKFCADKNGQTEIHLERWANQIN